MSGASSHPEAGMRHTPCLFCDGAEDRELYPAILDRERLNGYTFSARREREREHYRIVACRRCGLVRSDPVLEAAELDLLYADSTFLFAEEAPFAARTYRELLQSLNRRHGCHLKSLLEIGCSTGFFLQQAVESGIAEVMGFEPSTHCRAAADAAIRERIVTAPFDPVRVGERRFDLACGFQVIDHLPDPLGTVRDMVSVLNDPGWILLVCHDVRSWSARLLGEASPIFDVEHIYLFDRNTLGRLLEKVGVEVLEVGSLSNTYPLGYWMRMTPGMAPVARLLPDWLTDRPVGLRAGNLYAFGKVSGRKVP
ncbi:MAG: class I SAM-dependent methyltransferase [Magnetococcales bacterium]|nr:class I SAM-dependent methyltransferase [Magnetococcales bacterium]